MSHEHKEKKIFSLYLQFLQKIKKFQKLTFISILIGLMASTLLRKWLKKQEKKIEMVLFSEHSRKTSKGWFNKFVVEIKRNQKRIKNCKLFIGTEVKIKDFKGSLDLNNLIRKRCDYIMASVHRFPGEKGNIFKNKNIYSKKKAIEIEYKLQKCIKNSKFDILGHPFGMSLKRFNAQPKWKLFQSLIKECNRNNKIFEINFHYHKNYKKLIDECIKQKLIFLLVLMLIKKILEE